ncbi:MAG: hypothetical protein DRO73_08485 [Candidatus Thorarchaeota archaeon]|nr:MAG: hypothetical protein DRO73_08485 [Candidatus Thorarchaeota archaeon]
MKASNVTTRWLALLCAFGILCGLQVGVCYAAGVENNKMGKHVRFTGIDADVSVSALKYPGGREPLATEGLLDNAALEVIVALRDANARWLICERRRDYEYVAYKYTIEHNGLTEDYAYKGRYDRGAVFRLPSEYLLYYGAVTRCMLKESDEYYTVTLAPTEDIEGAGVPNFYLWAFPAPKPQSWLTWEEMKLIGKLPKPSGKTGLKLTFDKKTGHLLHESFLLTGASGEEETSSIGHEISYVYGKDGWPVEVIHVNPEWRVTSHFAVFNGLWMLTGGEVVFAGRDVPSIMFSLEDITVVR